MLLLTNGPLRLLFIAQALYWSCSLIGITLTSIVGVSLAPVPALATLPLGILMLGNLLSVHPLAMLMQKRGRRVGLCLGAMCGVVGGGLLASGIYIGEFWLVAAAPALIGTYQASAMYYRYAALEAVGTAQNGRAAALVVGGGVLAAIVAPEAICWQCHFQAHLSPWQGWLLLVHCLWPFCPMGASRPELGRVGR